MKFRGCKFDPHDRRDLIFTAGHIDLPRRVDNRKIAVPIRNQGAEGSCHVEGTEVLTLEGWKDFKDVTNSDELATINPNTLSLEYQKPTELHNYKYNGEIFKTTHKFLDFGITPDHRMFVRKWNERKRTLTADYGFVEIQELGWYSGLLSAPSNFSGTHARTVFVDGEPTTSCTDHDYKFNGDDFIEFMGIFLAEGCLYVDKNKNYRIEIACCKEHNRETVFDIVDKLGFNISTYKDRFVIRNKRVFDYLKRFDPNGTLSKFVPSFIKNATIPQIELFLNAFRLGDGHETGDGRRWYYTSSSRLADDLQEMIFKIGKNTTVIEKEPKDVCIRGRTIKADNCSTAYVISEWRKSSLSIERNRQLFTEQYEGNVYCATVPNSTLVTRFNGKILISGNCVGFAIAKTIEMAYRKQSKCPDLSERWAYEYAKRHDEWPGNNYEGSSVRGGLKGANKAGVCVERFWPYRPNRRGRPHSRAAIDAAKHKIIKYTRIAGITNIKAAVHSRGAVAAAAMVHEGWLRPRRNGVIPFNSRHGMLGGHAFTIVGFGGVGFWIANSWGSRWGKKGFGVLPYRDAELHLVDAWTVQVSATAPEPKPTICEKCGRPL